MEREVGSGVQKEQMFADVRIIRKRCPGKEYQWIDSLFPLTEYSKNIEQSCLFAYLFTQECSKNCTASLNGETNMVLVSRRRKLLVH